MPGQPAETPAAALSFRQLRLFEAIGDFRSVRRASEGCGLSQPAVTQALAKLEEQIGAVLVDRRASGSYLNELGEIFHARVKRFFDQTERAVIATGAAAAASARPIVNRLTRSQVRTLIGAIEHGSFEAAARGSAFPPPRSSVPRGTWRGASASPCSTAPRRACSSARSAPASASR